MTIYDAPAMTFNEFLNIPDGTAVENHGWDQCVALANLYNEGVLQGGFVQTPNAVGWWFNEDVAAVHGFDRVLDNPQVGDIFVASAGLYDSENGHIGVVVRAWDGSTFGTMEQNGGARYVARYDRGMVNMDGFLRTVRQDLINPAPAPITSNQRQAGPNGVFRRAAPTTQSEHLEPDLEAGVVGNFGGWIHGELVGGNDMWYQGVSGDWFWAGAFTTWGPDGLTDLNPVAPPVIVPEPVPPVIIPPIIVPEPVPIGTAPEPPVVVAPPVEPVPEPTPVEPPVIVQPSATGTPIPAKEVPMTPEEIARQKEQIATLPAADIGAIIKSAKNRMIAYAIYAGISMVVTNVAIGFVALQSPFPGWLVVAIAVVGNLAVPFAALAVANARNTPAVVVS